MGFLCDGNWFVGSICDVDGLCGVLGKPSSYSYKSPCIVKRVGVYFICFDNPLENLKHTHQSNAK